MNLAVFVLSLATCGGGSSSYFQAGPQAQLSFQLFQPGIRGSAMVEWPLDRYQYPVYHGYSSYASYYPSVRTFPERRMMSPYLQGAAEIINPPNAPLLKPPRRYTQRGQD